MRLLLILPLLMLHCCSCKSKVTSHKAEAGNVTLPVIIVDTGSYTWEGNYAALMQMQQQKQYRVEGLPLCDDSKGKFLDNGKLDKYGYYTPYAYQHTEGADSLRVAFEFITNCCLNFTGDIDRKGDTLVLTYFLKEGSGSACDCSCDYRMTYVVKKQAASNSVVRIRKG